MLARVERVASGADVHLELGLGGARVELIATGAGHAHDLVLGVDAVFHCRSPEPHARKDAGGLKGTRNLISEPTFSKLARRNSRFPRHSWIKHESLQIV